MSEAVLAHRPISRHSRATRIVHLGLAGAVIMQLLSSLVMSSPKPGEPDDMFFEVHEYAGLAALGFALIFWAVVLVRRHGTETASLLPWFGARDRRAVWQDVGNHASHLWRGEMVPFDQSGPMASAIHGLGLLLMTVMATLGAIWFALELVGATGRLAELAIEVHKLFGNVAWAYLIGHGLLAIVHHVRGEASLGEMWSFRSTGAGRES